jgi:hypothetical protein
MIDQFACCSDTSSSRLECSSLDGRNPASVPSSPAPANRWWYLAWPLVNSGWHGRGFDAAAGLVDDDHSPRGPHVR